MEKKVIGVEEKKIEIQSSIGYRNRNMLFPVIAELKESLPDLNIRYNKMTTTEQHIGLENESIDIAIGIEFPHWKEAGYEVYELKKVETLIVMSKEHPLAKKNKLEYEDLCGETFFLTSPNGYQVDEIFKDVFSLQDVRQIKVSQSEIAYFKVLSDNGLTISNPHDPYLMNNPYYHTIPFESEYADSYVCVVNPKNQNPVINIFLELLKIKK